MRLGCSVGLCSKHIVTLLCRWAGLLPSFGIGYWIGWLRLKHFAAASKRFKDAPLISMQKSNDGSWDQKVWGRVLCRFTLCQKYQKG